MKLVIDLITCCNSRTFIKTLHKYNSNKSQDLQKVSFFYIRVAVYIYIILFVKPS